ncbi:MAG: hypothetical protein Q8M31_19835 [Beijerinckiaceae bacterium]|nr:hypothetical protein [Beijerinckiaceae bacterium]
MTDDVQGRAYDYAGLMDAAWLRANTPIAEADYYLCAPRLTGLNRTTSVIRSDSAEGRCAPCRSAG